MNVGNSVYRSVDFICPCCYGPTRVGVYGNNTWVSFGAYKRQFETCNACIDIEAKYLALTQKKAMEDEMAAMDESMVKEQGGMYPIIPTSKPYFTALKFLYDLEHYRKLSETTIKELYHKNKEEILENRQKQLSQTMLFE